MARFVSFEEAIQLAIGRWCAKPMQWGVDDCLLSLADIVKDARGYDPAAYFRDRYSTRRGALLATRTFGGPVGALRAAARRHGWKRVEPEHARTGAIAYYSKSHFVIKHGALWIQRLDVAGFGAEPRLPIERAWRIP